MALIPGTRLGSYEILSLVGVGGMGEVYRARDTKLNRDVALKILPATFTDDSDRLARFKREAQVLAQLNHPNIAAIYGLEESNGVQALVLELVAGPTLAERIARGPIAVDEALPIARQIAEALEAAHERGIVHRDLKPANIKVRPDGTVKVLDFGLAKLADPVTEVQPPVNVTAAPTITSPAMMTGIGVILGTAAYMSPEQAKGQPADKRSDIWAFGAVVFEMLTGSRPFRGDDVSETLASILKDDPDWTLLPESTPANIRTLLQRSLRKEWRRRIGDAGACRIELEDAVAGESAVPTSRRLSWRLGIVAALLVAVVAVAAAVGFAIGSGRRTSAAAPLIPARLILPVESDAEPAEGASVAVSPDGTQVALIARKGNVARLFVRPINASEARVIAGTEGAASPFFSPDGHWLGFFADGKLKKVSMTGNVVETLTDANANGGGAWGPNGTIVFARGTGQERQLLEIPSAGGSPHSLLRPAPSAQRIAFGYPEYLPGGEALLFTSNSASGDAADNLSIEILTIRSGERRVLVDGAYAPRFLPTGHLLFQKPGAVMAALLNVNRGELVGPPVTVIQGIRQTYNGLGAFGCSQVGTCVYVAGNAVAERTVTLVDRSGTSQVLPLPPKGYFHPRFSPDGTKVLFWIQQRRCDIEVYDLRRGTTIRLTSEGDNHSPVWTPDGQRITYISRNQTPAYELVTRPASGGGVVQQLAVSRQNLGAIVPLSWSPDGKMLAFADGGDIWGFQGLERGRIALVQSRFNETTPAFSPDGHWLAYSSDESGRSEIYVQGVPAPSEKYPISSDGGTEPVWARDGHELFYRNGDQMLAVAVTISPAFKADRPRLLFTGAFAGSDTMVTNYDVSPDGQRFVMPNAGDDRTRNQVIVLLNWLEELKARVPVK